MLHSGTLSLLKQIFELIFFLILVVSTVWADYCNRLYQYPKDEHKVSSQIRVRDTFALDIFLKQNRLSLEGFTYSLVYLTPDCPESWFDGVICMESLPL